MKMDKGPEVFLRALATGDPIQIAEAEEFQRESFRAKFGFYPEEVEHIPCRQGCACSGGLGYHDHDE